MRGSSGSRELLCVILVLAIVLIPNFPSQVYAPSPPQPSTFFLHKQSSKALNTITTVLWANTTQLWASTTQTEVRTAARTSPAVWDFYSQPAVAGNVTFTGPLTFILYLSSLTNTGAGTVITGTVSKITSAGTPVPLAVASISNAPISSTINVYTLTIVSNTYQIEAGAIFDFTITVSITVTGSRTITLSYDAPSLRSQVTVTFQSRLGVTSFSSLNQTGVQTGFFSRNWTGPGRQVTLRAIVFDALGLYDVALASLNLTSPTGSSLLTNTPMLLVQGMSQNYTGTWSLNVTYSSGDPSGVYTSSLRVVDNTGITLTMLLTYQVYAVWRLNLQAVSQDQTPIPIPAASVTISNGLVPVYLGASNTTGWVNPSDIFLRDNATYQFKAYWQGSLVNQTLSYTPRSSLNIPLMLSVYRVDFSAVFRDGNGKPLPQPPSSFQLAYPNGTVTSPSPTAAYMLPVGTYSISSVLWKGVDVTPPSSTFNPKSGLPVLNLQVYDLTILVVDQNGQALSGAKITLTLGGQVLAQGTSGNDGVLVVGSLPKGQYIVQVDEQSQTVKSTLDLNQNLSSKVQVSIPQSGPTWVSQSLGWILLVGAAVGGLLGYRQFTRSRLAYKEEPFDYFDTITSGGFRDGDAVLIEGDTGAGKTTMCEQLAYKSLIAGNPALFLTYDNPDNVRGSMKSFHWDPSQYEVKQQFQVVPCELSTGDGGGHGWGTLDNFYAITALTMSINTSLAQAGKGKPTVIIDSLNQLVDSASLNGLANLLAETSMKLKKLGGRFFVTVSKSMSNAALAKLEEIFDSVIELTPVVEGGKKFSDLRVKKMKGRAFEGSTFRTRIDSRRGVVFQVRRTIHTK